MKKTLYLLAISAALFSNKLYAQCNAPKINSFSPVTGFIGSTVTINGAYFDNTPSNNQVYFGAVQATVITASFGTLTVQVPVGASTAPISVKNSCNLTAYSPLSFNGIFCPTPLTNSTYENTAVNLTGINGAYNMLLQDMDLDGKPDIVTCYGGVTIARNTSTPGSLSFTASNFSGGGSSVSTADFDGDGKRDLFCVARVFRNTSTGPGNIGLTNVSGLGFSGYQGATGDFNNDGKIDIVYENGNIAYFYRNTSTGPGNVSFTLSMSVNVGQRCTGMQCADVDNDGLTDFIATQGNGNRAVTLRNTTTAGAGTFTFEGLEAWSSGGSYPYRCQLADFDKDGKIDLASVNYLSPATAVPVWRNTSTPGNISFGTVVTFAGPYQNYRIGVGDVDGDGYPDIVTRPNGVEQRFSVYRNTSTGAGNISFASRIIYTSSGSEVGGMLIGDMDGDFVPDVATSGISSNRIVVHRNTSAQADNTAPTALCKNITVALGVNGTVTVTGAMIDNGSGDACGIASLKINNAASKVFTCADTGNNVVTLLVTDKANNTASCTATVRVKPAAIITNGATTVCDGQFVKLTANEGDSYKWYKNGVEITDSVSKTYYARSTGNYKVEVTNSGGCSGYSDEVSVTVNSNPTVTVAPFGPTHLCSGSLTLTASLSSIYQWRKGGTNITGATLQSYTATSTGTYSVKVIDIFGCSATSTDVEVTNTPSEINVVGNSNSIADGDNSPSASDDTDFGTIGSDANTFTIENTGSGPLNISAITISGSGASDFSLSGITTPTIVAANSSATFTVTFSRATLGTSNALINIANNDCDEGNYDFAIAGELACTFPAFSSCPSDMNISTATGTCGNTATYSVAADGIPTPTLSYYFSGSTSGSGSGDGSGSAFNLGTTHVMVISSNPCGKDTCSFDVTVTDDEDPVITNCPSNISVSNDAGKCGAKVSWTAPSYSDNCSANLSSNYSPGDYFPVGTTTVTYTATDAANNTTTCSFDVTVADDEDPVITNCPSNLSVSNDAGKCGAKVSWTAPSYSDNCSANLSSNYSPGDYFPVGTTTVTYTATDAANNSATCSFDVTVTDDEDPLITNCPSNISVSNDAGKCGAKVSWTVPSYSDNCSANLSSNYSSGDYFPVGTTTVTYTATDAANNSSVCTFDVTVSDSEKPNTVCKNTTVTLSSGSASISVSDINDNSTDNCGISTISLSETTFDCSDIGNQSVTLTVTDIHNNTSTCSATVTVVGAVPSCSLSSTSNTIYLGYGPQTATISASASGGSSFTYAWTGSGLSGSGSSVTFTPTAQGMYTIECTVTNNYGCVTTCSMKVCVLDIRVPKQSGKVYLCHVPPGNPGNPQTLSISVNAVPSHLNNHSGDALGYCGQSCSSLGKRSVDYDNLVTQGNDNGRIELTYSPNPFHSSLRITFVSDLTSDPVIRVYDLAGQLVEEIQVSSQISMAEVGASLPDGIYMVQFTQGSYIKHFRVIKAN